MTLNQPFQCNTSTHSSPELPAKRASTSPSAQDRYPLSNNPIETQVHRGLTFVSWHISGAQLYAATAWQPCMLRVGETNVPVILSLQDGPILKLEYQSHAMPVVFEDFKVFMDEPTLGRIELGGSSTEAGFSFSSAPLDLGPHFNGATFKFEIPTG